jgi:hypothetical protein
MQLHQGTSSAHCITDVCYLSTGAGSCPCCWPAALCSTSHGYSACLQTRVHLLSRSWSSRSNLHLSARLLASLQRIMSSLYLRLSDIGTTVASSCQALRTPGPCVTGVCTSGAEPRTLFLAHKHGSVFMQSFDSLTPILHLSPPPSISVQPRHHDRHARAVRQPVLGIKRIDAGSLA